MKKVFTLICIVASINLYAQKEKRFTPAYFMSGELTSADSFNRFISLAIPDYQLKSVDSADKSKWNFNFSNGSSSLKITYYVEVAGNNGPNSTGKKSLSHVELRSGFPTLAKIYNRMYKTNVTVEDLQKQLPLRGPIYYGFSDYVWNKNNYWFSLADFGSEGYCMLFRKTK